MVVAPHPLRGKLPDLVKVGPMVLRQPLVADCPVEALHVGILLGLAGLDVLNVDATRACPVQQRGADVLGPVVAADHSRLAAPGHDLRQRADHAMRRQREVHLDAQGLAVEVVDHIKQPDAAPVFQLVVHEVHRPDLVAVLGHRERLWFLAHQALARLDAQVQLQLPVDPVHAFVVPGETAHVAQMQETQPEAPVAVVVGQAQQPLGNLVVLDATPGLVAVAGLADLKRLASSPDR